MNTPAAPTTAAMDSPIATFDQREPDARADVVETAAVVRPGAGPAMMVPMTSVLLAESLTAGGRGAAASASGTNDALTPPAKGARAAASSATLA